MHSITKLKIIAGLAVMLLMTVPVVSFARDNSVTGGLSVGLDLDDRNSDGDGSGNGNYKRLFLSPMVLFKSLSEKDSFELQASPSIKYDLKDSNTDWDNNLRVAADRFVNKEWQLGFSNHYLINDYSNTETSSTDPQLSNDRGRQRYWRNTLGLFTNYFYAEDSLFRLDLGYIVLRNKGQTYSGDDEYDRFTTNLRNEHRYNSIWRSTMDFGFVLGDFKSNNSEQGNIQPEDQLSKDLKEYRLSLALDNESIIHNPLTLSYNYIAARYDESEQDDNDIYQMRLTWRRDYSPQMYTKLGAGPAYSKTEGKKGSWGGNGIAEVNYAVEHGFFNFQVEKVYDVDNFSGNNQSGVTDIWATRFSGSYQLQSNLTLSARLGYDYEDREELLPRPGNSTKIDSYHNDRYLAGTGLSYTFLQFYTASVDYSFTKLNTDQVGGNDYDDHRLLLTLSWQKELFHW